MRYSLLSSAGEWPLIHSSLFLSVQDALIVAQLIVIITTMMTHFLRLQDIANLSLPLDILSSYHLSQTLTVIIPGSTFNNLHVSGTFLPTAQWASWFWVDFAMKLNASMFIQTWKQGLLPKCYLNIKCIINLLYLQSVTWRLGWLYIVGCNRQFWTDNCE